MNAGMLRLDAVVPWLVLAATAAGSCGRWHWLLDLASHFRWYLLLLACGWLGARFLRTAPAGRFGLALAIVWNAWGILPYWLPVGGPRRPDDGTAAPVSLVSVNVHSGNRAHDRLLAYLRRERPDLVTILELTPAWAEAIHGLDDLYPHRLVEPRTDNFGVAILSLWPLADQRMQTFGIADYPTAIATVTPEGWPPFRVVATHPYPPLNAEASHRLRTQLHGLGEFLALPGPPTIVAGDLNATPWSFAFRDFVTLTGLRDSSLGWGLQPTWNARFWLPRIPIDHILVPRGTQVVRRTIGPDVGSDHLPVVAELILPPAGTE
jgi:endonuclease/exonuclease/phosphatase (EEP) superfamily protein YafD